MMKVLKVVAVAFLFSLSCGAYAQKAMFVRAYDVAGRKVNKGHVAMVTDTSLQLNGTSGSVIPVGSIGFIRTKRSAGRNVLTGAVISTVGWTIYAFAGGKSAGMKTRGAAIEAGAIGIGFGGPVGAAVGGLTVPFKHSKKYLINGDMTKWKEFETMITEKKD